MFERGSTYSELSYFEDSINICRYITNVFLGLALFSAYTLVIGGLVIWDIIGLHMIYTGMWDVDSIWSTGLMLTVLFGGYWGAAALIFRVKHPKVKKDKEPSLFSLWLKSKKDKVCFGVKFVGE